MSELPTDDTERYRCRACVEQLTRRVDEIPEWDLSDGDEYEVVGTGPGKATVERVDDDSYTAEVFRWAVTNQVGIELKTDFSQEEFGELVDKEAGR